MSRSKSRGDFTLTFEETEDAVTHPNDIEKLAADQAIQRGPILPYGRA